MVTHTGQIIRFNPRACDGCRRCLPACSYGALQSIPGERELFIDYWSCTGCGTCVTICPREALTLQVQRKEV